MHWRKRSAVHVSCSLAALGVSLVGTPANALLGLDSTPPSVSIVKPANGEAVRGPVAIEASANDGLLGSGVSRVEYQLDTADGAWTALSGSLLSTTYRGTWSSEAVADGSHSLYVRATDADGNQRLVYAVVVVGNPPATPTGVTAKAPVAPSNGGYVDLSWSSNGEADLTGYAVYRSTSSGGPYTKVASASVAFYRDSGLSNGTSYSYVVTALDTAGNESTSSAQVSATPTDTRAPVASAVAAAPSGTTAADITWNTDELASSQVEYGTTTVLGASTAVDAARTASHRVRLTGLQPSTTYYYRVRSVDAAGNAGTSAVQSFFTGVDLAPTVGIVNVANGAVLQAPVTLQAQATDDFGVTQVEYSVGGLVWNAMGFNSLTGFYEVRLDTNTMGEGARKIGVRATDGAQHTAQAAIDVTVDLAPPSVDMLSPVVDAHLESGLSHLIQVAANDQGSGVVSVEWQLYLVPFGVQLEAAPEPDPAAWQPLPLNPQSGRYETNWLAPVVVTEQLIYGYARATDGLGKTSTFVREFVVLQAGADFQFTGSAGQDVSGVVSIEPIGANGGNRIGIEVVGRFLTPGGRYRVTVTGEGVTHSAELIADARGRGTAAVEADTTMTDEFAATVTVSGPGF